MEDNVDLSSIAAKAFGDIKQPKPLPQPSNPRVEPKKSRGQKRPTGSHIPVEELPDTLTEILSVVLGKQGARRLAQKLIELAINGDRQAIFYIYDRLDGKPKQTQVETKEPDEPLVLMLRELVNDSKAINGRAKRPALKAGAVNEGQIREVTSE